MVILSAFLIFAFYTGPSFRFFTYKTFVFVSLFFNVFNSSNVYDSILFLKITFRHPNWTYIMDPNIMTIWLIWWVCSFVEVIVIKFFFLLFIFLIFLIFFTFFTFFTFFIFFFLLIWILAGNHWGSYILLLLLIVRAFFWKLIIAWVCLFP